MMNSSSSCFDCAVDPSQYNTLDDMLEVIELLRKRPEIGFLYLSPAVEKNSVHYFYYYLKCVRRHPNRCSKVILESTVFKVPFALCAELSRTWIS